MADDTPIKIVSSNRRASFDYELGERFEAGMSLTGAEIKSIRTGKMDVRDAFVLIRQGNALLINAYIPQYEMATGFNKATEERRERLLLLHRREISNITKGIEQKGFTAIATKVYLKRGRAKIEIALARGKKNYDKRESIAKRDSQRDIDRALRDR